MSLHFAILFWLALIFLVSYVYTRINEKNWQRILKKSPI